MQLNDNTRRITAQDVLTEIVNLKQVIFEVTDDCNLSCKYCIYGGFYGGFDHRESNRMDFNDAKAVIDYLCGVWRESVSLANNSITYIGFYGGEPLLNFPFIRQIVEYVESLNVPRRFRFAMTSNCLLLDRYMDYLAEKEFYLLCSLDGDKIGNGYRVRKDGTSSFDKVFSNIKLLQSKHPEYFLKFVSFNTVLHNLNSVQDTNAFIQKEFGKTSRFSELSPVGVLPEKLEDFKNAFREVVESIHQSENYDSLCDELGVSNPEAQQIIRYIEAYEENIYDSYLDLFVEEQQRKTIPSGTCIPFNKKMFVKVDGKIMQCEQIPHKFALGFVRDGKVNIDLDRIAGDFNSSLDRIQALCSTCYRRNMCPKCLYQIEMTDNTFKKCDYHMNKGEYERYRKEFLKYMHDHPGTYRLAMFNSMTV
jgi:uncharacterized protein